MAQVRFRFNALKRFAQRMKMQHRERQFRGRVGTMWRLIGLIYLSFIRKRFVIYSHGGGNWAPLKHKRQRGAKSSAAVLRDTGILFNALSLGMPGNLFKKIRHGVRVGFDKGVQHGDDSSFTIYKIARAHDEGWGKLPKRQILVVPDRATASKMRRTIQKQISRLGKDSEHA